MTAKKGMKTYTMDSTLKLVIDIAIEGEVTMKQLERGVDALMELARGVSSEQVDGTSEWALMCEGWEIKEGEGTP